MEGYDEKPLNPIPPVVWLLFLPILAVETVVTLGQFGLVGGDLGIGYRQEAVGRFAYAPEMGRAMWAAGEWPLDYVMRVVTYPFVHTGLAHAAFVGVFLLALGKMVGEVFSGLATAAIFFGAAVAGAVVYSLAPMTQAPLIGGYPAVYGLIGAFTYILWTRLGAAQAPQARAFSLIGALLAIQLVFAAIFGAGWDWIAEIAGFGAGFGLSFLLAPGGGARALARLRRR